MTTSTTTRAKVLYSFAAAGTTAHEHYVCDTTGNVFSRKTKEPKKLNLIKSGTKREIFKLNGVVNGHNTFTKEEVKKMCYQHQKTNDAYVLVNNAKMSRTAFDKLKIGAEPVAVITNDVKVAELPKQQTAQMTLPLVAQPTPEPLQRNEKFQIAYVGKTGQQHMMIANGKPMVFDDAQRAIDRAIKSSRENPETSSYVVVKVVAVVRPTRDVAVEIVR